MAAEQRANDPSEKWHLVKRRGLIAGAAALVAGMVAKQTSQPVAAGITADSRFFATGITGDGFYTGTRSNGTFLDRGVACQGSLLGVYGYGDGIRGIGVQGDGSGRDAGVIGNGGGTSGYGVVGVGGGPNGIGVRATGQGTGTGVEAASGDNNGVGVQGYSAGPIGTGVQGNGGGDGSTNTTGFPIGVRGSISNTGYGVYGKAGNGASVYGVATGGVGVQGVGNGTGVQGNGGGDTSSNETGFPIGVRGSIPNSGYGVYGKAGNGAGVYGTVTGGGYAVNGVASVGTGVVGQSTSNTGVYGTSTSGVGVFGVSGGGAGQPYGVVGAVNSAPGFALFGVANVSGTVGFAAGAGVAGAIAGQFAGPVNIYNNGAIAPGDLYIQGNYTAGGTKSAAVPHPDGTHRLLYCVESPEAWFEDFGEGTLTAGKAEMKLDADFAAVVDTSKLHVFCMPHDEHHLHVAHRTATGFAVTAAPSTTAAAAGKKASELNGTFSYRVVAKRKDVAAPRLAKYVVPQEVKAATPLVLPMLPQHEQKG